MKLLVGVLLIVALITQITKSNVIDNKELETKIQTMWEKVNEELNIFEEGLNASLDPSKEDTYNKLIKDVIAKMRTRFSKHFTEIEEEARKNGKLENVSKETPFFKITKDILNELKHDIGEIIKTFKNFDSNKKTQLTKAIDGYYNSLIDCAQNYIEECARNPDNIFGNYEYMQSWRDIENKCKENLLKEKNNLDATLNSLDVQDRVFVLNSIYFNTL